MATGSLAAKMKLKPGSRAALVRAPEGFPGTLDPLPEGVELHETIDGLYDWVQIFVKNQAELGETLAPAVAALRPTGMLWISFPKGTSKIQTDLTRDRGWDALREVDLKWVNLVSVDDTWSAFALRPYKPGEPKQEFML